MLEKDLSRMFPGTKLESAEFSDLKDINSEVTVGVRGVLGRIVKPGGNGWITLPAWMGRLELTNQMAALSEREWTLLHDFPWVQNYEVTYIFPEGAEVEELEPIDYQTPFGSVTRTQETGAGEVKVFLQVKLDVLKVDPDEYAAFREFCTQADTYAGQRLRILLKKGN